MFKSAKAVGLVVLIVALIAGGLAYLVGPGCKPISTTVVSVDQIRKIAQLSTVEYQVSTLVHVQKDKAWYEWKHAEFLVFLKGKIMGSVDLKAADIKILNDQNKKHIKITFKKNAVIISDPAIGPDGIREIVCKNPNIFHPINDEDRNKAVRFAIEKLKKVASDDKIEVKTAEEAKRVVSGFLTTLGYTSEIKFEGMDI